MLEAARDLLARFDPTLVLTREAMTLVEVFSELEHLASAGKALAAKRASEGELWRRKGYKSAAEWLARTSGSKVGEAVGLLRTAESLDGLEATTEAFKAGRLSPRQAKVVATAAKADPDAERDLLSTAERASLKDLESKARQVRQAASPESDEQRHARLHRQRSVRTWTDEESGAGCGQWMLPPSEHAQLMARLEEGRDRAFNAARRDGREESLEAYAADALMELVRTGENTDDPERRHRSVRDTKVIVRVDHSALVRGHTEPGERCEIAGVGSVPVSVVREWVAGDAFKAAIVADGVDIRSVVHLGRQPLALQVTALEWIHGTECARRGCNATATLEIDHVVEWAYTRHTTLDELTRLCPADHDLKTYSGFRAGPLGSDGKRDLTPPETTQRELFDSS